MQQYACAEPDLLNHLVGAGEQHRRNFQAKSFCRLQVEHELELRRLLDGKVRRTDAFENV
jgi:hypothetical protein